MLTRARKYRTSLQANPLNHVVVYDQATVFLRPELTHYSRDEIKRHQVVQDRILVLKKTLDTAKFEPERLNIRGAIAAYESGEIVYSKQYTLIWRGRVVDQADSYGKFTEDRLSRLDRYAELYGPHWLWWESPLWLEPSQQIVARGCQIIHRQDSPSGFGQFFINQVGFEPAHPGGISNILSGFCKTCRLGHTDASNLGFWTVAVSRTIGRSRRHCLLPRLWTKIGV